jgi:hypothetical protein
MGHEEAPNFIVGRKKPKKDYAEFGMRISNDEEPLVNEGSLDKDAAKRLLALNEKEFADFLGSNDEIGNVISDDEPILLTDKLKEMEKPYVSDEDASDDLEKEPSLL